VGRSAYRHSEGCARACRTTEATEGSPCGRRISGATDLWASPFDKKSYKINGKTQFYPIHDYIPPSEFRVGETITILFTHIADPTHVWFGYLTSITS
jgi:hypothetical protein